MARLIVDGKWTREAFPITVLMCLNVRAGTTKETICMRGIRAIAKANGWDYQQFRKVGITPQQMVDTGDIRATVALAKIYRRWKRGK